MPKEATPNTMLSPMEIGLLKRRMITICRRRGITLQEGVREALEAFSHTHSTHQRRKEDSESQHTVGNGEGQSQSTGRVGARLPATRPTNRK